MPLALDLNSTVIHAMQPIVRTKEEMINDKR